MKFDPQIHHRRSIRIPGYDYTREAVYYVTLVTQGRECHFGAMVETEMRLCDHGRVAAECWTAIPDHFPQVELGEYVIMPNHVHGILILHGPISADPGAAKSSSADARAATTSSPHVGATQWVAPTSGGRIPTGPKRGSIGAIIGAYKMAMTRQIMREYDGPSRIWQRNYYEHIIRDAKDHQRITDYILNNPQNWDHDEENIP